MTLVVIIIGIFLFLGFILRFGMRFFRRFLNAVIRFLDNDYNSIEGSARRTAEVAGDILIIVVGIIFIWCILTAIF